MAARLLEGRPVAEQIKAELAEIWRGLSSSME